MTKIKAPRERKEPRERISHEAYLASMFAVFRALPTLTALDCERLDAARIMYGFGMPGVRGVTVYSVWNHDAKAGAKCDHGRPKSIAEAQAKPKCGCKLGHIASINAGWQRTTLELAETLAHELGHVVADVGAGHEAAWRDACARLGFTQARAETDAQAFTWDWFAPDVAKALQALPLPNDGSPLAPGSAGAAGPYGKPISRPTVRPCSAGWQTRGGTSRGVGSGTRNVLWLCKCPKPVKVRASRNSGLDATCNKCKAKFVIDVGSVPPSDGEPKRRKDSTRDTRDEATKQGQAAGKARENAKRGAKAKGLTKAQVAQVKAMQAPLPKGHKAHPGDGDKEPMA